MDRDEAKSYHRFFTHKHTQHPNTFKVQIQILSSKNCIVGNAIMCLRIDECKLRARVPFDWFNFFGIALLPSYTSILSITVQSYPKSSI